MSVEAKLPSSGSQSAMRTSNDHSRTALISASSPLPLLKTVSEYLGRLSRCPSYLLARLLILGSESGGKSLASSLSFCRDRKSVV